MDRIINWEIIKEVSVYEQLKKRLAERKELDIKNIIEDFDEDELEEEFEVLDQEFEVYTEKLELVSDLSAYENQKQQKYLQTLANIDVNDNFKKGQKLKMMISYGSLFTTYDKTNEFTDEEAFMLSASTYSVPLDVLNNYVMILAEEKVRKNIISKTDDFMEQTDIAFAIMESQDEYDLNFINQGSYDFLVGNSLSIIENFESEKTR